MLLTYLLIDVGVPKSLLESISQSVVSTNANFWVTPPADSTALFGFSGQATTYPSQ